MVDVYGRVGFAMVSITAQMEVMKLMSYAVVSNIYLSIWKNLFLTRESYSGYWFFCNELEMYVNIACIVCIEMYDKKDKLFRCFKTLMPT